jgi:hypothetical protein
MDGNRHKSRLAPALFVVGMLCAMVAVYTLAYFHRGSRMMEAGGLEPYTVRIFDSRLEPIIYAPAAWVESAFTGTKIVCEPDQE